MSHSKMTKKGKSLYVDSWNPRAKKFIISCSICGYTGFSPNILNDDFAIDRVNKAIQTSLQKIYKPLVLDSFQRCSDCASIQDSKDKRT